MLIFGHKVIPDYKEDGGHGDHEKGKGSLKVQHTSCNHHRQVTCWEREHRWGPSLAPAADQPPALTRLSQGEVQSRSHWMQSCAVFAAWPEKPRTLAGPVQRKVSTLLFPVSAIWAPTKPLTLKVQWSWINASGLGCESSHFIDRSVLQNGLWNTLLWRRQNRRPAHVQR